MIVHESKIRVRYSETDKMGYVYYGNYPQYYEVGRNELMRNFGVTYKKLEDSGIIMPVISMNIKYLSPATYDDLLTIKTSITKMPEIRVVFHYEIFNQNKKMLNTGETTLVFVKENTRKPLRIPEYLKNELVEYFK